MGDMNLMMATIVQGTAMKPLQNGSLVGHLDVDQASRAMVASTTTTHIFQSSPQPPPLQSTLPQHNLHEQQQQQQQLQQQQQPQQQLELQDLKCESNSQGGQDSSETIGVDSLNNGVKNEEAEQEPEVDIVINNVVCSFSVKCHLNLRQIALTGKHVEYRRENGMLTMKLRKPYTTASMWSSGKVTCTGATSEDSCRIAARRFARSLQKLGFNTRFTNYRIVNVLGTCSMPFAIKITAFSERHRDVAEYEPELHPGVTYKLKNPKATLKIFSTGSITVTAPSVQDVQRAIEEIYPLVYEFRKERTREEQIIVDKKKALKEEPPSDMDEDVVDD